MIGGLNFTIEEAQEKIWVTTWESPALLQSLEVVQTRGSMDSLVINQEVQVQSLSSYKMQCGQSRLTPKILTCSSPSHHPRSSDDKRPVGWGWGVGYLWNSCQKGVLDKDLLQEFWEDGGSYTRIIFWIFLNPQRAKWKSHRQIITTKSRLQSVPLNPKTQVGGTKQQTAQTCLLVVKGRRQQREIMQQPMDLYSGKP